MHNFIVVIDCMLARARRLDELAWTRVNQLYDSGTLYVAEFSRHKWKLCDKKASRYVFCDKRSTFYFQGAD